MEKSDPRRVASGEMCSAAPIGQANDDSLLLETVLVFSLVRPALHPLPCFSFVWLLDLGL